MSRKGNWLKRRYHFESLSCEFIAFNIPKCTMLVRREYLSVLRLDKVLHAEQNHFGMNFLWVEWCIRWMIYITLAEHFWPYTEEAAAFTELCTFEFESQKPSIAMAVTVPCTLQELFSQQFRSKLLVWFVPTQQSAVNSLTNWIFNSVKMAGVVHWIDGRAHQPHVVEKCCPSIHIT